MAKLARSVVLGTAGHIDHGKTTLVKALTGTDTDRLPEEKRRGITIELGFAPWVIEDGLEASIVDVPGHENFVRTMVAGAGGIDAVILVVSAEDGVMPQTREHINVCELLGVRDGVVALTKVDQLEDDEESIELALDDVRTGLQNSVFAEVPIIPCSGITSVGIDELQHAVRKVLQRVPPRDSSGAVVLPLDRVFTMKGHGTVVTGTLLRGALDLDQETTVELQTAGEGREPREVRARALQVRMTGRTKALAGSRVALNLAGIDVGEVHRGDVLTRGPAVVRTDVLHVQMKHLVHDRHPWKRGTTCQVCAGTAHIGGRLDPLTNGDGDSGDVTVAPGGAGLIRVRLDAPIPTWRDQRVIVRGFHDPASLGASAAENQGKTLGGGVVVDPEPSAGRKQRARWIAVGRALEDPDPKARLLALVEDAGVAGVEADSLARRAGCSDPQGVLEPATGKGGPITALRNGRYVSREHLSPLVTAAIAAVDRFHAKHPMQPGLSRAAVEGSLPGLVAPDVAAHVVELAIDRGALRAADDKGNLARPGKGTHSDGDLPPPAKKVLDAYIEAGISAPTLKDIQARCGLAPKQVLEIVGLLQRVGKLVRVTKDISFAKQSHDALVQQVRGHLQRNETIDVQALKQMTGLSRKYVVPFLEHLDQQQVTRRRGDVRVAGPRA